MSERDDFDRIVEGLDLGLSFPDEVPDPPPPAPAAHVVRAESSDDEPDPEPFYRRVDPAPVLPRTRGPLLAWCALLGTPIALAVATLLHVFLPRSVLVGAALIVVAAGIYLIAQLPEHGPSRRDWPDDGAVL
jgi:hypothetical protein